MQQLRQAGITTRGIAVFDSLQSIGAYIEGLLTRRPTRAPIGLRLRNHKNNPDTVVDFAVDTLFAVTHEKVYIREIDVKSGLVVFALVSSRESQACMWITACAGNTGSLRAYNAFIGGTEGFTHKPITRSPGAENRPPRQSILEGQIFAPSECAIGSYS